RKEVRGLPEADVVMQNGGSLDVAGLLPKTAEAGTSAWEHPGSCAPHPDDWDQHWATYGEALQGKPAGAYRRRVIMSLLGRPPAGSTVLDIGSGQGGLAIHLRETYPDVTVSGVEYSRVGVEHSRAAAAARGTDVSFSQLDLLQPVTLGPGQRAAGYAICSEVLEHVDDPVRLLSNARNLLLPGCRLIVTVPGGPRSAFDRHIGHRRHFQPADLRRVLTDAGYVVDRVLRAGFPFFNLYRLAVIARGRRLIADAERPASVKPSRVEAAAVRFFNLGLRHVPADSPLGWQLLAVAYLPSAGFAELTCTSPGSHAQIAKATAGFAGKP
ncbi:MAG: class I SAM-dependent methyltransferase, partial [Actinobacteria bacterium]|nr:class I SAM-dependent methyltransferase [Actinomycetota bacterium]